MGARLRCFFAARAMSGWGRDRLNDALDATLVDDEAALTLEGVEALCGTRELVVGASWGRG